MIVIGIDPHEQTHTAVAVEGATGRVIGELTVKARARGFERLVAWARGLPPERTFAVEDGPHVSGALERHLIARGERSVRVPPRMVGEARRTDRVAGKSDPVDATAVARAALRHPELPEASLAGIERQIGLLVAHREMLVNERTDKIRIHGPAQDYLASKWGEGKTKTGSIRALKRHITRVVFKTMTSLERPADRLTAAAA